MRPGGIVLVDNVLWAGRVLDPQTVADQAIVDFNDDGPGRRPGRGGLLPIADGLTWPAGRR